LRHHDRDVRLQRQEAQPVNPISDLDQLLAALEPRLEACEYAFCCLPDGADIPSGVEPFAAVREAEGLTLVIPVERARSFEWPYQGPFRLISLRVHSSLEAVGLTAAVSSALAAEGISANVVAGFHHDHILVPAGREASALAALTRLSRSTGHIRTD
jgi:hypothetical protein